MSIARAKKIKVVLFDVDGVLTDGTIWFFPASASGPRSTDVHREQKGDAPGFGIVSQRISETVALRARDLRVDFLFQGAENKSAVLDKILHESGAREEEIAFVGDDVIDLPVMRRCGLAIAVANARPQVKEIAHYQTPSRGGHGAARDAVEYILQAQGTLEKVIDAY